MSDNWSWIDELDASEVSSEGVITFEKCLRSEETEWDSGADIVNTGVRYADWKYKAIRNIVNNTKYSYSKVLKSLTKVGLFALLKRITKQDVLATHVVNDMMSMLSIIEGRRERFTDSIRLELYGYKRKISDSRNVYYYGRVHEIISNIAMNLDMNNSEVTELVMSEGMLTSSKYFNKGVKAHAAAEIEWFDEFLERRRNQVLEDADWVTEWVIKLDKAFGALDEKAMKRIEQFREGMRDKIGG